MSDNITNSTDHVEASNKSADSTNIIDIAVFVFGAISSLIGMIILNMNTPLIKLNRIKKTILNVLLAHTILLFVILTLTLVSSNRRKGLRELVLRSRLKHTTPARVFPCVFAWDARRGSVFL